MSSRASMHGLGVDMDRYSFIVEDFHSVFLDGFSGAPRTLGLPLPERCARLRERDLARIVMLLTNNQSIREVILFPLQRPLG